MSEKVRISEELYAKIKEIADKSGKSIRELIEEAVKAYLVGTQPDKPIKSTTAKVITVHFDTKCRSCGAEIKAGNLAYYVRVVYEDNTQKSYVYCLDCYYKDTALAEYFIKRKKLESIVRGLERKANSLVKEIEAMNVYIDLMKLKSEIHNYWRDMISLLSDENKERITELVDKLNEIIDRISSLELTVKNSNIFRQAVGRRKRAEVKTFNRS